MIPHQRTILSNKSNFLQVDSEEIKSPGEVVDDVLIYLVPCLKSFLFLGSCINHPVCVQYKGKGPGVKRSEELMQGAMSGTPV